MFVTFHMLLSVSHVFTFVCLMSPFYNSEAIFDADVFFIFTMLNAVYH